MTRKHECFGEWGKGRWGLLFLFLLVLLSFQIFLSGVGVRVSVLGLGFFHLPSFFDIWKKGFVLRLGYCVLGILVDCSTTDPISVCFFGFSKINGPSSLGARS